MRQNLILEYFLQTITHDLAATSSASKLFLMRKQKNSFILNLKKIPFDQKKKKKKKKIYIYIFFFFFFIYIYIYIFFFFFFFFFFFAYVVNPAGNAFCFPCQADAHPTELSVGLGLFLVDVFLRIKAPLINKYAFYQRFIAFYQYLCLPPPQPPPLGLGDMSPPFRAGRHIVFARIVCLSVRPSVRLSKNRVENHSKYLHETSCKY